MQQGISLPPSSPPSIFLLLFILSRASSSCFFQASQLCGATRVGQAHYYRFWPSSLPSEPWRTLVTRVMKLAYSEPLLYTAAHGGRWIAPKDAVLIGDDTPHYTAAVAVTAVAASPAGLSPFWVSLA